MSRVDFRRPRAGQAGPSSVFGVSMGGFGAIKLSLHHPELFAFAGGLSSSVDVPSRPFSVRRIGQWEHHPSIFGPWGSATCHDNDPFVLVMSSDPTTAPYYFLTCGDQEGLLPANRRLANSLQRRGFHVVPGGHDWTQWNARLDDCFGRLLEQVDHGMN